MSGVYITNDVGNWRIKSINELATSLLVCCLSPVPRKCHAICDLSIKRFGFAWKMICCRWHRLALGNMTIESSLKDVKLIFIWQIHSFIVKRIKIFIRRTHTHAHAQHLINFWYQCVHGTALNEVLCRSHVIKSLRIKTRSRCRSVLMRFHRGFVWERLSEQLISARKNSETKVVSQFRFWLKPQTPDSSHCSEQMKFFTKLSIFQV